MFGFGKKKAEKIKETSDAQIDEKELKKMEDKIPSGMKETAQRMMSGQFDMNDMLAQLKQIKKMSNFSGLLKMVPGMSGAVSAMKEKIVEKSGVCAAKERGYLRKWVPPLDIPVET